ncbi:MAG: SRPBCC family protein [Mycobacterium sp.]
MARTSDVEGVERIIAAPPEKIVAILTDPGRHREFDGSGTVRDVRGDTVRLTRGDRFTMSMRVGVPYAMVNTVIEYQENRRIAWQTRGPTPLGRFVAGRIWRYELEPVERGTLVRESWDISREFALTKPLIRSVGAATRRNMASTLAHLDRIVCGQRTR